MKLHRFSIAIAMLLVLGSLGGEVRTASAAELVLGGELVVTNASRNQFRLVGHNGSFTAPAGTPVEALDGKPVQIELGSDGRVLQITETPIHVDRVTHSEEVVTGQLVVSDPVLRTFTLAGADRMYTAPPDIDIRRFAGQRVEVHVSERGRVAALTLAPPAVSGSVGTPCVYNGRSFSDGASVCQANTQYRCASGMWSSLGITCGSESATASGSPRSCAVGDATVASGSAVCRAGMTFRCVDGEWVSIGAPCR